MILVERNTQGHLEAVMEYSIVDESGAPRPFSGKYVRVDQLEVNPGSNYRPFLKRCIQQIADWHPQTIAAYWQRRDKPGQPQLGFTRNRLLKYTQGEVR